MFKSLSVSPAEAEYLTQSTLLQSSSAVWYTQRKGRITASNFGAVCHTSITQPSRSLVDKITQRCSVPKVPALIWGLENENKAMKEYALLAKQHHRDFELKNTGLHINTKFPHLGATPDGLISCSCCGQGVLEIKCPFSIRNASPCTAAYLETTCFFLQVLLLSEAALSVSDQRQGSSCRERGIHLGHSPGARAWGDCAAYL